MAVIKCKMCGGDLVLTEGSAIAECEYCGSIQTVPSADNERKLTLFGRANRLRANCEYDKASGVYEAIIADFPEEAEAYWGLLLCKYGIEYVDDPATGKKIPTCHRSSFSSILEDADFEQTLENADPVARKVYREEAKQIEELRKGILEVSSKEDPYDIFICYKETAENGQRTLDSVLAQDIYDALTEKGYRVFFSRITLEDKLGQEYEPYIFAALHSAKVMLAVGTDYEYFNAVWVRNEWSRYLKLMEEDKSKHLIPCFKDLDAYDMPKEFAKLQAQDLGKVGALQDLLRGIDKLISPTASSTVIKEHSLDVAAQLARGDQALQKKDWQVAQNRFDLALVAEPECAEAYVGKLLAERKLKHRASLKKQRKSLRKSSNFREAVKYADDTLRQELLSYETVIKKRLLRTWITCIAIVLCLWLSVELTHSITRQCYLRSNLSATTANTIFSYLRWYRIDDAAYFAALEAGDPQHSSLPVPEKITITDRIVPLYSDLSGGAKKQITDISLSHLTKLPDYMYYGSSNLSSITLPEDLVEIGDSAFRDCSSLTSITIPEGVTKIGNSAFDGCTALTSITIPEGVTEIGGSAFRDCSSLTSITIPDGVTEIGGNAFSGCTALTSITIPDGVTKIGNYAFSGCYGLTSITLPDSVTTIAGSAFSGCTALTSITIPESVTEIGDSVFSGCTGLTSITIPDSVASLRGSVFSDCTKLKKIYCQAKKKPSGWAYSWNVDCNAEVIWGATG